VSDKELEFRRRWYQAHIARFERDSERVAHEQDVRRRFRDSAAEGLALRDALIRSGDVLAFREGIQQWSIRDYTIAFKSMGGAGFVNQLVKRTDDHASLARVLGDALLPPSDAAAAIAKIQSLADYVESIKVGAYPAPGRAPFFLSCYWALSDEQWPIAWPRSVSFLEFVTGEALPAPPPERYERFFAVHRQLEDDPWRFWWVAAWWDETKPVFLDPVLVDRCAYGLGLEVEERHDDETSGSAADANAAAISHVARHIGSVLLDDVSAAVGRSLRVLPLRKSSRTRHELSVDWSTKDNGGLGVKLWVGAHGASLGLRPGWVRDGWYDEAAAVVDRTPLPGFEKLAAVGTNDARDVGYVGGLQGEFVYSRWFEPDQLEGSNLRAETKAVAAAVQPIFDELIRLATGDGSVNGPDPLSAAVEEFRGHGYPTSTDEEHVADREQFARLLQPDAIALADPRELGRIWNTRRYGGPGSQAVLNTSVRSGEAADYDRIIDTFRFVCWGDGDDADRIDTVLDVDSPRYVKGLGESVIVKMLAISHPERYVPVFPYSGPRGKRAMLQLLDLPEPSGDSRGRLQVESNDTLRERLDRFFPNDPWGMTQFLYWYAERETPRPPDPIDVISQLADELLVERGFLDDIISLLEDKGQVIFYGPPGTGKTFLARKLAEALVPDPTRRALVQFHPSSSYEDFFEGYRPETSVDGDMTYRLTPGPLALLAERALEAPSKRHIMVIDEINRANLPKVLGELLFLFEYRDEQVRTLYRPDDAFELPKDLWFIGTMNTADRSIALVDAALRRRFHFVPFFPNQGPMAGLLDRWLVKHGESGWVGELVAMVNDELADALGGPHLQLGPSHFMKAGLDEDALRRIWRYNIEPFIEDQFFGDREQIERFRFEAVLRRYREDSEDGVLTEGERTSDVQIPASTRLAEQPAPASDAPISDDEGAAAPETR
jgi:5-methylcytosine-specific restriction protein B